MWPPTPTKPNGQPRTVPTNPTQHNLPAKPIQRPPLPLERIHDVQARDGLALGVLGVGDGVADHGLEEGLEHAAGFFVDHFERGSVSRDLVDMVAERGLIKEDGDGRKRGGEGRR